MMSKENIVLVSVIVVLVIVSIGFLSLQDTWTQITGGATTDSAQGKVNITAYFSVSLSNNISNGGVDFGVISNLPTTYQNASANYNETTNGTNYYISVSTDANVNVDFCLYADLLNTTGGEYIGVSNISYSNSSSTNDNLIPTSFGIPLTTTNTKGPYGITAGNSAYYRFWLNVSASQAAGAYNNTMFFEGVQTGNSCS